MVGGDLAAFVRDLRDQPGGDIGVRAGISVTQAMLAAGLVDELRLVVSPNTGGRGCRLWDGVPATAMELVRSVTTPTGHLLLDHRPRRVADQGSGWGPEEPSAATR